MLVLLRIRFGCCPYFVCERRRQIVGNNQRSCATAENVTHLVEKGFLEMARRQNRRVIRMHPRLRRTAMELLHAADVYAESGLEHESHRARSQSREQWRRTRLTYAPIPIPPSVVFDEIYEAWDDEPPFQEALEIDPPAEGGNTVLRESLDAILREAFD